MTADEWPYPDDGTSDAIMQQWWNENQAWWRGFLNVPSRAEQLIKWLEEDYLLDGVPVPEWATQEHKQ